MRRTKIICTIGPREDDYAILLSLAKEMDVARFNFSHGDHTGHLARLRNMRKAAEETGRPIAAMLDTKGPEIRTGLLENHQPVELVKDSIFILTTEERLGNGKEGFINYRDLTEDIKSGHRILIDDGLIELIVENVEENRVFCRVKNGGVLGEKKGVNIPDISLRLPGITEKDKEDILFGIENGFDFVAASFIRDAKGIREIREIIDSLHSPMKIIAKIESREGVDNFEEIVEAADGIMIARGDLGVEVDPKTLPRLQKEMIRKSSYEGKPVITATQMLDSMIRNPRPTRAEVTDVANAIDDGTDAIMLSGETASGKYPVEALSMMASIAEYTEQFQEHHLFRYRDMDRDLYDSISNTTCRAAVTAAHELKAEAIVTPTMTGNTALLLSKYRPDCEVYALSSNQTTVRQMMLFWGVYPVYAEQLASAGDIFHQSAAVLKNKNVLREGSLCVIAAGVRQGEINRRKSSATNIMRIMQV